jgi:STE24 endopeptidase
MLAIAALTLAFFALLGWLATRSWFYAGLAVSPNLTLPNDALALILLLLVGSVFGVFASPLLAGWSRRDEFEADAFASRHADGAALASALLKLHEDNAATLTPDPMYARFYYSHPPAVERLAALALRPVGAAAP